MATRTLVSNLEFSVPRPQDQNLIAWTYDPIAISSANGVGSGQILLWRLIPGVTGTATNIVIHLTVAGATLTAGQCFAGLYDSTGTRVGVTADQSGNWNSTGTKTMVMTSPPTVTAGSLYWVGILWNGTTSPGFAGAPAVTAVNAGAPVATIRFGANGSGLTTLPSNFTPTASSSYGAAFWAALS